MADSQRDTVRPAEPAPEAEVLQRALSGAIFPLEPRQLDLLAGENEAPAELRSRLSSLARREYGSLGDVEAALASVA
ncbi:MAG TPA: hypothetical protein VK013_11460 [Myxococcaceae bacterium]|nr:hypothetical protein [Myxococcaceae bacterium]